MKVTKKGKSDKFEQLEARKKELCEQVQRLKKEIDDISCEIIEEEYKPFKNGQDVMCVVPAGRVKKECRCKFIISTPFPMVYPYKNDGELGARGFYVSDVKDLKECD